MNLYHAPAAPGIADPCYSKRAAATLEAGRVSRYHAVPTVQPQNVGHHSWGVAVLALYVTGGSASRPLLIEALLHDTAELFTGDVPFTVKRDNDDIKARFDDMENSARATDLILPRMRLTPHDEAVLKLCDTLEGFVWCVKTEVNGPIKDRWIVSFRKAISKFGCLDPAELRRAVELFELFGGTMTDGKPLF